MSKILVIDDDPDIRTLIQFKLGQLGHEVLVEADGAAGLAAAMVERPDLVVLDWMMPRLTGPEVCHSLRAEPSLAHVSVIMLTARAEPEDARQGQSAGADEYLTKPFSPAEFARRVESLLARS